MVMLMVMLMVMMTMLLMTTPDRTDLVVGVVLVVELAGVDSDVPLVDGGGVDTVWQAEDGGLRETGSVRSAHNHVTHYGLDLCKHPESENIDGYF